MGVADEFKGAALFVKIAFVLLLIASVCVWIAFTCTGWARSDSKNNEFNIYIGLWKICTGGVYSPTCIDIDGWALDWFMATKALVTIGFCGINLSLFLVILYMFVPHCKTNREVGMAVSIICIVTGIVYLIGVIVFGVKFHEYYIAVSGKDGISTVSKFNYAFGLSIVALFFEIVAGSLVIIDRKTLPQDDTSTGYTMRDI